MFTLSSKKTFAFALILGGLMASIYLFSSGALGREEPVEGADALVEAGSRSVANAPEAPDVERKKELAPRSMTASYYGYALEGLSTASGEPFDPEGHTAAHKELPLGTELLVKRGDESVRVTVNDRGPYIAGRELDLSVGAAQEIGLTGPGEDQVEVILL